MTDIFNEYNCKIIDKHLKYKVYRVSQKLLTSLLKHFIISPEFQRNLNKDKIEEIYKESNDNELWYNTHGNIILGSIEKENKKINYYILDGQHRIESLKFCKNEFVINVQLIFFDSMIDMKKYFKSINKNSNFEIEYQTTDNDYVQDIKIYIKKRLDKEFAKAFCKSTITLGNRYNLNEFVNLIDDTSIKLFYDSNEKEFDDGKFLYDTICDINDDTLGKFDKLENQNLYFNGIDKNVFDYQFILALKNIKWIDNLLDEDQLVIFDKIREKKPKISKKLSNAVWNKYIGKDNAIGKCFSCKEKISIQYFECGHLISHKNGGDTTIENLRPFCSQCNRHLGTANFNL
jgi:hypothetical protein|uniref:HNH nuclease domain-containing protein n=1 Tax=viral metagenome TaxID=1070528 RepID=A0A6C0H0L2_9ZZZZ